MARTRARITSKQKSARRRNIKIARATRGKGGRGRLGGSVVLVSHTGKMGMKKGLGTMGMAKGAAGKTSPAQLRGIVGGFKRQGYIR